MNNGKASIIQLQKSILHQSNSLTHYLLTTPYCKILTLQSTSYLISLA